MKRAFNFLKQNTARSSSVTVNKTVSSGIVTHVAITSNKVLADDDKVSLTYRDSKGAIPIFQSITMLQLAELADLLTGSAKRSTSGSNVVIPVGCFDLFQSDANLDITLELYGSTNVTCEGVSIPAATAAGDVYVTCLQEDVLVNHVKSYIPVTGNNKITDSCEVYLINAATYLNETIEVCLKSDRSNILSVVEFLGLSNALNEVEGKNNTNVCVIYSEESPLSELEEIRVSNSAMKLLYAVNVYNHGSLLTVAARDQRNQVVAAQSLAKTDSEKASVISAVMRDPNLKPKNGGAVTKPHNSVRNQAK